MQLEFKLISYDIAVQQISLRTSSLESLPP